VIEVELPRSASRSLWYHRAHADSGPCRFALKLQLKQHQGQAQSEVLALRRAEHPFIVHLERAFSLDNCFALLLELCPTDLNRRLCEIVDEEGRSIGLTPFDCARYMGQIMLALSFLHTQEQIVFRDVKPENILISTRDEAKLTDFGLAKVVTSAERMTLAGTMGFLPPEVTSIQSDEPNSSEEILSLTRPDDGEGGTSTHFSGRGAVRRTTSSVGFRSPFKVDTYAFGVTLQLCLLGEDGGRRRDVPKKGPMLLPLHISEEENGEILASLRDNGRLSPHAYDLLVSNLLCRDQHARRLLSDSKVQDHPFFLVELACTDTAECLLEGTGSSPSTSVMHRFSRAGSRSMIGVRTPDASRRNVVDRLMRRGHEEV